MSSAENLPSVLSMKSLVFTESPWRTSGVKAIFFFGGCVGGVFVGWGWGEGNKTKITNLSSAETAQRVVKTMVCVLFICFVS